MTTKLDSSAIGRAGLSVGPELLQRILASDADIVLLVDPEGIISGAETNPSNPGLPAAADWPGRPLREVLTVESVAKLDTHLERLEAGENVPSTELNHPLGSGPDLAMRYAVHRIDAKGTLLMLGHDLRPIADMQQRLVEAQLAMERDYEAQREADTRYRVLMEAVDDAVVVISVANGRIRDLNAPAARLLGDSRGDLSGHPVGRAFEDRGRGELLDEMTRRAISGEGGAIEVKARRSGRELQAAPTVFRAGGERLIMCRLEEPAAASAVPDELSGNLERLYNEGIDGIVFLDRDGVIRAANEAFVNLTDAAGVQTVRGRSFSDFLSRGAVDLKVLLDNVRRARQLRHYSTRLATDFSGEVAVDMSATWLDDRARPCVVVVVRDATRSEASRASGLPGGEEGARSLRELVGSASLKEIVAETNDVVEKMCIETAIELTGNNRVAAAEMLGLSRQSLYVKLRKHGLLSRDGS